MIDIHRSKVSRNGFGLYIILALWKKNKSREFQNNNTSFLGTSHYDAKWSYTGSIRREDISGKRANEPNKPITPFS